MSQAVHVPRHRAARLRAVGSGGGAWQRATLPGLADTGVVLEEEAVGAPEGAVRPEVPITNEMTSALDASVQSTILNLIRQLRAALDLTILFIGHNLTDARYIADTNGPVFRVVATACVAIIAVMAAAVLGLTVAGWLGIGGEDSVTEDTVTNVMTVGGLRRPHFGPRVMSSVAAEASGTG